MQVAQIVHSVVGVLYIAAMLVHIYMGTLGMDKRRLRRDGEWRRRHQLGQILPLSWYEEETGVKAKDESQAQPGPKSNTDR